jgi:hypothetical protein
MESTTATVIIVVLFALIVIAIIFRFRQSISVQIETWLGSFSAKGSNKQATTSPRRSHIRTGDINSKRDTQLRTQRGDRDYKIGNIRSGQDTIIEDDVVPTDKAPKADPPA